MKHKYISNHFLMLFTIKLIKLFSFAKVKALGLFFNINKKIYKTHEITLLLLKCLLLYLFHTLFTVDYDMNFVFKNTYTPV